MFKRLDLFEGGLCSVVIANLTGVDWDTGKDCGEFCGENTLTGPKSECYKHLFKHKTTG